MTQAKRSSKETPSPDSAEWAKGFYGAYDHYSKVLRTWLVAYGIGGPVLIVSSEPLLERIATSSVSKELGLLFLSGVGLQVGIAAINKATMWACYYGELYPEFHRKKRYKVAVWFSEQFWVDFLIDIASIVFFVVATFMVFMTVTSTS